MIFDLGSTTPIEILLLSNRSYEARYIAGYSYKWYKPTIYLLGRSFPRQRRKRQKKKRSAFMRVIKHPVSAHSKKLTLSEFFFSYRGNWARKLHSCTIADSFCSSFCTVFFSTDPTRCTVFWPRKNSTA